MKSGSGACRSCSPTARAMGTRIRSKRRRQHSGRNIWRGREPSKMRPVEEHLNPPTPVSRPEASPTAVRRGFLQARFRAETRCLTDAAAGRFGIWRTNWRPSAIASQRNSPAVARRSCRSAGRVALGKPLKMQCRAEMIAHGSSGNRRHAASRRVLSFEPGLARPDRYGAPGASRGCPSRRACRHAQDCLTMACPAEYNSLIRPPRMRCFPLPLLRSPDDTRQDARERRPPYRDCQGRSRCRYGSREDAAARIQAGSKLASSRRPASVNTHRPALNCTSGASSRSAPAIWFSEQATPLNSAPFSNRYGSDIGPTSNRRGSKPISWNRRLRIICLVNRCPIGRVLRHCVPVRLSNRGPSVHSGRTSAPIIPYLVQTAFGHRSRTAVSSGRRSASTVALWWQYGPAEQ